MGKIICPRCKSFDVSSDMSVASFAQGSIFNDKVCNKCGYSGQFFPEIDDDKVNKKKR